jgi:hypothetical protein
MRWGHTGLVVLGLAVASAAGGEAAESPEAVEARTLFQSLFGKDLKRAEATPAAEDDLALAARLLGTAREAPDSPAFLSLLCDHAYNLAAAHPDGRDTAFRAMELLAEHVPERREDAAACIQRLRKAEDPGDAAAEAAAEPAADPTARLDALLVEIQEKRLAGSLVEAAALYRQAQGMAKAAGDDRAPAIQQAAEALGHRIRLERRARDVRTMLVRQPENVGVREGLVRLYLVNLNDPVRAAEVLKGVEDEDLKKYVPAAARPLEEAPELACLELGEWYAGLAEAAPDDAKADMYGRSKAYLERFLTVHEAKDMRRVQANVAMEKVDTALAKLTAPTTASAKARKPQENVNAAEETADLPESGVIRPGSWVDVLTAVDPKRHALSGTWERQGGAVVAVGGERSRRLEVPVAVQGSYELHARFERAEGDDGMCFVLPVGSARPTLAFSAHHGGASGLEKVDGKGLLENPVSVRPHNLKNGQVYDLHVKVLVRGNHGRVAVTLDKKRFLSWEGQTTALTPEFNMPHENTFGLVAWNSKGKFHSLRLKVLSGVARVLPTARGK